MFESAERLLDPMEIRTITIVGNGNVAEHYNNVMLKKGLDVKIVSSHEPFNRKYFSSDLVILAVKDDALPQVTQNILQSLQSPLEDNQILVHTSGYMQTDFLNSLCKNYGSFYPLQTLKKGIEIDFSDVPLCTWANNEKSMQLLERLAKKLSNIHYTLTDEQRKTLHISAVFANNFTNHLMYISKTLMENKDLSFELLYPLINRTFENIKQKDPKLCQTGPAFRNEKHIMQEHLKQLSTLEQEIYTSISKSIINTYKD